MSTENLETITIASFLRDLVDNVSESHGAAADGINITVQAEPLSVHLDFAITIGLLITELLSNALKHANATAVTVEFRKQPGMRAILSVRDDGSEALDGRRA